MCDFPDIVDSLKAESAEFILNKYNWQDVANTTYNLYKKVSKK